MPNQLINKSRIKILNNNRNKKIKIRPRMTDRTIQTSRMQCKETLVTMMKTLLRQSMLKKSSTGSKRIIMMAKKKTTIKKKKPITRKKSSHMRRKLKN